MSTGTLTGALGSAPVTAVFRSVLAGRLRVIAYHDIRDAPTFAAHIEHITARYTPVDGEQVRAALRGRILPRHAVWLTFDDAHPDVVELAMPLLDQAGVRAMLFVCPGVVDTLTPYWWQLVDAAIALGLHQTVSPHADAAGFRAGLKRVPDDRRREMVRRVHELLRDTDEASATHRQVTSEQLRLWVAHGHELGNHTWDHPLLDQCSPQEQRRQVADADEWLRGLTGGPVSFFAHPNGNPGAAAEAELQTRGYGPPLLFDHRVAQLPAERISRVRLDAFAPAPRMRAVVSGAHPAAFAAAAAVRRA